MVRGITGLARSAERIRWDPADQTDIVEAETLLRDIGPQRLIGIALPVMQRLIDTEGTLCKQVGFSPSIRPTPTHDKFLLYGDLATDSMKVWAHAWGKKQAGGDTTAQYAELPHKHRNRIAAEPIDKSYRMRTWRYVPEQGLALPADGVWRPNTEVWLHPEDRVYGVGDAWSLDTLDIHSITPEQGTVSIVIEGPTLCDYSYTYDEATGQISGAFPDQPTAFNELLESLQASSDTSGDAVAVDDRFL